jgi:hypothetical protein
MVSVLVARSVCLRKNTIRWRVDPVLRERKHVTLLARLDEGNRSFLDFHVSHDMDRCRRFDISLSDPWLNRRQPRSDLRSFCKVVALVEATRPDT